MNLPKAPSWLYWVIATATAAFTMTVFVYAEFPTRREHDELKGDIKERLNRIEEKVDRLLEKSKP